MAKAAKPKKRVVVRKRRKKLDDVVRDAAQKTWAAPKTLTAGQHPFRDISAL